MRVAIIATGSRGDVEPYIALGKGVPSTNTARIHELPAPFVHS